MKNFNEIKLTDSENMFKDTPNNILICISNTNNQILSQLLY